MASFVLPDTFKTFPKLKAIKNRAMSFNSTFSLPKIPGKIFADAAIVINDNFYFNLGWQTSIGLIRIYVPLYQNWDQLNSDAKIETIFNRIRFSIGLPNLNLRQIF